MDTHNEHIETVVIGGGQAGLSVGHHLMRRKRSFVILDNHAASVTTGTGTGTP